MTGAPWRDTGFIETSPFFPDLMPAGGIFGEKGRRETIGQIVDRWKKSVML